MIIEAFMSGDKFSIVNPFLANGCISVNGDGICIILPLLLLVTEFKKYRFEKVNYR